MLSIWGKGVLKMEEQFGLLLTYFETQWAADITENDSNKEDY
jgi:hypothetical protein